MFTPENTKFDFETLNLLNEAAQKIGVNWYKLVGTGFIFFTKDKNVACPVFGGVVKGFGIQIDNFKKFDDLELAITINLNIEGVPDGIIRGHGVGKTCGILEISGFYYPRLSADEDNLYWVAYPDDETSDFMSVQGAVVFLN